MDYIYKPFYGSHFILNKLSVSWLGNWKTQFSMCAGVLTDESI